MKHKLTRNLGLKSISVLVAALIWLLIANMNNPLSSRIIRDVKVEIINQDSVADIDKAFDVLEGDTVTLKVKERSKVISSLTPANFRVVADMENLNAMDAVPLSVTCDHSMITWDEIEIYPSSMKVQLEQIKQSEFLVSVVTTGNTEKGYEVGTTGVIQGKTVQVAGPESLIKKIGKIVAPVNVNHVSKSKKYTTTLQVYDKNDERFNEAQMARISIKNSDGVLLENNQVTVRVTLWKVQSDISVQADVYGTPAEGYRVIGVTTIPENVSLAGNSNMLEELNGKLYLEDVISVDGASESFSQDINLSEILENLYDDKVRLSVDSDPDVTVTVAIEKTGDRTLSVPLSNLQLTNKPENMILTFSPPDAISVKIHSDNVSVYNVSEADIKGSIDLEACREPGSYEIPIEILLPDGYELATDVKIIVTSERAAQKETTQGTMEEMDNDQ